MLPVHLIYSLFSLLEHLKEVSGCVSDNKGTTLFVSALPLGQPFSCQPSMD